MEWITYDVVMKHVFPHLNKTEQLSVKLVCSYFYKNLKRRKKHTDRFGICGFCKHRLRKQKKKDTDGQPVLSSCGCYVHRRCLEWIKCRPQDHAHCVRLLQPRSGMPVRKGKSFVGIRDFFMFEKKTRKNYAFNVPLTIRLLEVRHISAHTTPLSASSDEIYHQILITVRKALKICFF
jgi:hypothetical protein